MASASTRQVVYALVGLTLGLVVARADQHTDAAALLERANAAYVTAGSSTGAAKLELMQEVRALLDQIVDEFPSSDLAVQIVLGEPVGLIDIAEVDAALASAPPGIGDYLPISDPAVAQRAEAMMQLTTGKRQEIQRRLALIGFDTSPVDGIFGPRTRTAIANWQTRYGWPATGYLDEFQVSVLASETDAAFAEWQSQPAQRAAKSRDNTGNDRPAGRYIGSDGCLREANGKRVPYFSFKCDFKGALRLD